MTNPTDSTAGDGRPFVAAGPSPAAMPRRQYDPMSDLSNSSTEAVPGVGADEVEAQIVELLSQVDAIQESAGDEFSLAALERQANLLEQAHDALSAALDAVDRP